MKLTRYALGLLAGLIIGSFIAGTCSAAASTRRTTPATHPSGPATQAVTAATRPATQTRPARVEDALAAAVKEALAGRFLQATKALRITAKAAPDNAAAAAALDLLERHLSRSNRSRTEQRREYTEAVRRVQHGMLAEQYLPKLAKAKVDEKLRKKISAVVSAYGEIGSCEGLMDADTKTANKLRAEATRALERTDAALKGTLKALKGDSSQYAKVLDGLVAALKQQLNACRQVWHDAKTDTTHQRSETADKLRPLEDELALAVADLEAMTAMKPWRIALTQGRLAKELAGTGITVNLVSPGLIATTEVKEQLARSAANADGASPWAKQLLDNYPLRRRIEIYGIPSINDVGKNLLTRHAVIAKDRIDADYLDMAGLPVDLRQFLTRHVVRLTQLGLQQGLHSVPLNTPHLVRSLGSNGYTANGVGRVVGEQQIHGAIDTVPRT